LKLGTIAARDSLFEPTAFGFKRARVKGIIPNFWHPLHIFGTDAATTFKFHAQMHYGRLVPADQTRSSTDTDKPARRV